MCVWLGQFFVVYLFISHVMMVIWDFIDVRCPRDGFLIVVRCGGFLSSSIDVLGS